MAASAWSAGCNWLGLDGQFAQTGGLLPMAESRETLLRHPYFACRDITMPVEYVQCAAAAERDSAEPVSSELVEFP